MIRNIFSPTQSSRYGSSLILRNSYLDRHDLHLQNVKATNVFTRPKSYGSQGSVPGHGAGKGGGAGGSIRESGGGLGEYGAAQEEHYFFNKQKEQLQELKKKMKKNKPVDLTRKEGK